MSIKDGSLHRPLQSRAFGLNVLICCRFNTPTPTPLPPALSRSPKVNGKRPGSSPPFAPRRPSSLVLWSSAKRWPVHNVFINVFKNSRPKWEKRTQGSKNRRTDAYDHTVFRSVLSNLNRLSMAGNYFSINVLLANQISSLLWAQCSPLSGITSNQCTTQNSPLLIFMHGCLGQSQGKMIAPLNWTERSASSKRKGQRTGFLTPSWKGIGSLSASTDLLERVPNPNQCSLWHQ